MAGLNDGWDDDDDLDITPSDDDLGETSGEGWGDNDDDLPLGEDDETPTSRNNTAVATFNPVPPQVSTADGWGDDVDDLDLDDGFGDELPKNRSVAETPPESPTHVPPTTQNSFGEGVSLPANESTGGWENDEDLFGEEEEEEEEDTNTRNALKMALPLAPPSGPWDPKLQKIIQDLQSYVSSLDRILSSINAVLEFEYNTPQKAQELVDYYSGREKLAEYTRTKELPRMDYQVVTPYGYVETDKKQIAENFLPDESLVARSSNQSLLADLLQVITGPDLLVRPQFLAICVARWCKFTIHMGDDQNDMVNCACHLLLSFPTADGQRLDIAELKVSIVFAPHQPMVEYRVDTIDVLLKDYSRLASTAEFLSMMEGHFDELPGHEDVDLRNAPADIFRDAFLENSQKLFTQSTVGMKGALKQMESVVNIRQKLNIVKGGVKTISSYLPGTDQLLAVEQEAMEFASAREQQMKQESMFGPRPVHQPPPPTRARPQPPPRSTGGTDRPTSILGGLVSSGWRTLANSVAIPDEDPAIYGAPQQQTKQQPALYRKEESSALKLYQPEEPRPPPSPSIPPPREPMPAAPEAVFGGHQRAQEKTVAPYTSKPPNSRAGPRPSPPQQNQALRQDATVGGRTALDATPIKPQRVLPVESWDKLEEEVLTQLDMSDPMPVETSGQGDKIENAVVQETDLAEAGPGLHPTKPSVDTPFLPKELKNDKEVSVARTTFGFGESTEESFNEEVTGRSVQDGWDNDQIESEVFDSKDTSIDAEVLETSNPEPLQDPSLHKTMTSGPSDGGVKRQRRPLIVDVDYNSDDDIIETCKRWVNPRPYRPYLPI